MTTLLIAALAFVGSHFLLSSTPLRVALASRLGEARFTILFSLVSAATLFWLAAAFHASPRDHLLWVIPGSAHLSLGAMPIALFLLTAGQLRANPTAAMQRMPDPDWRPRGIMTVTRHPMMWGIGLWALLHVLANGDAAGLIFFGSFAVLALIGTLAIDAKKRRSWPPSVWQVFAASTSNLPLLAWLQRRTHIDLKGIGWVPVLATAALWALIVLWFHPHVLGTPIIAN
jgi:uncharacterized membrane protein